MRRPITLLLLVLLAAACSGNNPTVEVEDTYFADAATITTSYETAALGHFDEYLEALDGATAQTGDLIFVDANKTLFSGLATEFAVTVTALDGLMPPTAAAAAHGDWIAAGQALNDVFQGANAELSGLDEAGAVNEVVSGLPLLELQGAYRETCQKVAALATESDNPAAVIACQPPSDGA